MLSVGRTQLLLTLLESQTRTPDPSHSCPLQPCQTYSLLSVATNLKMPLWGEGRDAEGEGPSSLKPQVQLFLKVHFRQCQHQIACIRLEVALPVTSLPRCFEN